mgnify:CR=1 FL=1
MEEAETEAVAAGMSKGAACANGATCRTVKRSNHVTLRIGRSSQFRSACVRCICVGLSLQL